MRDDARFPDFKYETYQRSRRFAEKIRMLCTALDIEADFSQGLFQEIAQMQHWRNLVTHSSPYQIRETSIQNALNAPINLHKPYRNTEYARLADLENAKSFYFTAAKFIELLRETSGINPRASASYQIK
jgi:hypothetical protein